MYDKIHYKLKKKERKKKKKAQNSFVETQILYNDSEAPSVEFTGGIYIGWNLLACLEVFFK